MKGVGLAPRRWGETKWRDFSSPTVRVCCLSYKFEELKLRKASGLGCEYLKLLGERNSLMGDM